MWKFRLNRSDYSLIAMYWLIAIPVTYLSNIGLHGLSATLRALIFTVLLDTFTVLTMLYTLPNFLLRRSYINASLMGLLFLAIFGVIYRYGYANLFHESFTLNFYGVLAGMVDHARSYGILAIILAGKKFYDIQLQFERIEKFKAKNELQLLRSQINPHFLFNTLNNIYSLVEDKDKEAAEIITRLSDLLRYIIYDANKEFVPLKDELSFIKGYFNIEKIRHDHNARIDLKIIGEPRSWLISPSILISFIENAFKHGINSGRDTWVRVVCIIQEEVFQMTIENSFVPEYKAKEQGGLGLENAKRHLQLQYPDKHQLEISREKDRYSVTLTLELNE